MDSKITYKVVTIAASITVLAGCATSPQGKALQGGQYADMGSTVAALTLNDLAQEANPLALPALPIKFLFGWGIDRWTGTCAYRARLTKSLNTPMAIATVNNTAIALGAAGAVAIPLGVAAGVAWYMYSDKMFPGLHQCTPKRPTEGFLDEMPQEWAGTLNDFIDAAGKNDVPGMMGTFHKKVHTDWGGSYHGVEEGLKLGAPMSSYEFVATHVTPTAAFGVATMHQSGREKRIVTRFDFEDGKIIAMYQVDAQHYDGQ